MIEIVPARPTHIGPIAHRMRAIDKVECAVFGHNPKEALRLGLQSAALAWTALAGGQPVAMFGCSTISLIDGSARVWMLMTDEADKHSVSLVRFGRIYTKAMHQHFSLLTNMVHADNVKSIRWLARLGYAIGQVDVIRGQPMRPFVRCATQFLLP